MLLDNVNLFTVAGEGAHGMTMTQMLADLRNCSLKAADIHRLSLRGCEPC